MSGLYVHVPFCARACPYCDFDFVVGRRPDVEGYLRGLDREWTERGGAAAIDTVYVGGGTPTSLGVDGLARLLAWLHERVDRSRVVEWTVEANPEHLDAAMVGAIAKGGADRVSIGVQTLVPSGLVQLGRAHDAARARECVATARSEGLRVSIDLIVGWPGHSADALARDLAWVIEAEIEHVSVYALTIEAGTPWEALVRRRKREVPDGDEQAERLQQVERGLIDAGYEHYEIASYARTGTPKALHNAKYWTWSDYLGLGPSAASARYHDDGSVERRTNARGLAAWLAQAAPTCERLAPVDAAAEGLWVGLRRLDGLDLEAFLRRFPAVDRAWVEARCARQIALGNLGWRDDGRMLVVAPDRWLWHDDIAADLLTGP